MNNVNFIPKPPVAMGFSVRLLVSIAVMVLMICVLFVYFINHYAPRPMERSETKFVSPRATLESAEMVENLIREPIKQVVVSKHPNTFDTLKKSTSSQPLLITRQLPQNMNTNDYKDAANAQISVFQHDAASIDTSSGPILSTSVPTPNSLQPSYPNSNALHPNTYNQQNQQQEKLDFLHKQNENKYLLASQLEAPSSPYTISAGNIMPATLVTGINSDLPGTITARMRRNIFDTVSGNYLLIPQGATLLGKYDSKITFGQERLLVVWQRLGFPNGMSINLEAMPGVDLMSASGLHDTVDHHYLKLYGSALLYSLIVSGVNITAPKHEANDTSPIDVTAQTVAQQIAQVGTQMLAKNLNIQPTINIRPGTKFNVLLTKDLVLPHPYHSLLQ